MWTAIVNEWNIYTIRSDNKYFESIFNWFLKKTPNFKDYFFLIWNKTIEEISNELYNMIFWNYNDNNWAELDDLIENIKELNNKELKSELISIISKYKKNNSIYFDEYEISEYLNKYIQYTNIIDFSKLNIWMVFFLIYFLNNYPLDKESLKYGDYEIGDSLYDFVDAWIGDYSDNMKDWTFNIWSKYIDFDDLLLISEKLNAWFKIEQSWRAEEIIR